MSCGPGLRWVTLLSAIAAVTGEETIPMFGEISSPGYPAAYPNDSHSRWAIVVPQGYRVRLQFSFFQLEPSQGCIYDYLKVSSEGKPLGKFCGNDNTIVGNSPGTRVLTSRKNAMDLEFNSDFSNEGKYLGFLVHYEAIDVDECSEQDEETSLCDQLCHNSLGSYFCSCRRGYELQDDRKSCKVQCEEFFDQMSGHLMSPDYPLPYPPHLSCNYSLRVEHGFAISLRFLEPFEIDSHPEVKCPYDDLTIKYRNIVEGPFCGTKKPPSIDTQTNSVDILFNTDDSGDSRGWRLQYTTDRIKCPNLSETEHGSVDPKQADYRFLDQVTLTCDVGYKVMKIDRELKVFKAVCTGDGTWNKDIIPSCQITDCGDPKALDNGELKFLRESSVRNGYLSEIKYSCDKRYRMETQGNARYTCSEARQWVNEEVGVTIPHCAPVCGKPDNPVTKTRGRIFGGARAPVDSFPWQAYVLPPGGGRAAGILISDRWVMTAAHVLYPKGTSRPAQADLNKCQVYLGDNNLEDLMGTQAFPVEQVYLHEGFSGSRHYHHDLALVKLSQPVKLTASIMPVCLPSARSQSLYRPYLLGYVAGWGVTENQTVESHLRYVGLPMADQAKCAQAMRRAQDPAEALELTPAMFCAGTGLGETDSCQGDSGGAFSVHDRDSDTWYATGIVSWGLGCGVNGTYGVYTRVSSHRHWIDETLSGG